MKSPIDAAELGGGGGESPGDECLCGLSPLCEGLAEDEDSGLWLKVLKEKETKRKKIPKCN